VGYGGSCFPKDVRALARIARDVGIAPEVLDAVEKVNDRQKLLVADRVLAHFGGQVAGKRIALWGIAFKPKTDDIREAPAVTLMRKALGYGAKVVAFDPVANDNARHELGSAVTIVDDMYACAKDADALVISTDWDDFKSPDFDKLGQTMKHRVILDGRNLYRPAQMKERGFAYHSVGRASVKPA